MRDFYFFTNKEITAEDCFSTLKKEIKDVERNGGNIYINNKFASYLWFNYCKLTDFIVEDFESFKKKIPIENPFVTHFETHRSIDLKRVISILVKIYPELYIFDDNEFFGTAQEYLDTEFDF